MSGKRSVGKVLTLLILFLVTVAIVLVIFGYFTGVISFSGSSSHNVTITGEIVLSSTNSGAATLAIDVSNNGGPAITGVTLSCPTSDFSSANCGSLVLANSAGAISDSNPLSKGASVGGSSTVGLAPGADLSPGAQVTITAVLTFADGSTSTYQFLAATYA